MTTRMTQTSWTSVSTSSYASRKFPHMPSHSLEEVTCLTKRERGANIIHRYTLVRGTRVARTSRHPPTPCAGVVRRAGHFGATSSVLRLKEFNNHPRRESTRERYRHVCDRERCGDCDGCAVECVHLVANLPRQRFVLNLPQAGSVDVPDAGLCDVSETRSLRSLEPEAEEERHRHYGPLGGGRAGGELHRGEERGRDAERGSRSSTSRSFVGVDVGQRSTGLFPERRLLLLGGGHA